MDQSLMDRVARHWACTSKDYPILGRLLNDGDRRVFELKHILSHINKQIGRLEEAHEATDHGDETLIHDQKRTLGLLTKILMCVLQYAHHSGMKMEDLEKELGGLCEE